MTYYNVWNLPQNKLEASTAAYPNLSDRTWTWTYDAGGLPVTEAQPGGATLSKTYDELRRLLQVVGTGAGGNATASYGWDLVGNQLSASSTGGSQSLAYNDRGQLVSASGVAGSSTFGYDGDGQLVNRNDASGSTSFGWSARGELTSITEPLTGVHETLTYDDAGELSHIAFGSPGPSRDYQYDALGRLTSDVVKNPSGTAVYQAGYGYDANGDLTQKTLGAGQAGAGTHKYTYDWSNRLISWTDPANNVTTYGWDGAGNRTQAGSQSFSYDERNRLLSSAGKTYTWTARGDLLTETSSTMVSGYSYDALGRLTQVQQTAQPPLSGTTTIGYAYDGLDRVVKRNLVAWAYAGLSTKPSSDSSTLFSRTPSGLGVLATQSGATSLLTVEGPHEDLEASLNTSGALQGSFAYDPFGNALTGGSGSSILGYQGEWTDPATSKVSMAARWYDSGSGRFLSRDSVQPPIQGSTDTNLYAYGAANPLINTDPSGNCPMCIAIPIAATAPEWAPVVFGAAVVTLTAFTLVFTGTDSPVQSQSQSTWAASTPRAIDRWWEDISTSSTDAPVTDTPNSVTNISRQGESGGGGGWGSSAAARAAAAQHAAALRALTYLPLPALVKNLGGGRLYLPNGANVPTGLTSLPGATPWVPQDTGCHGCTELKSNGSGATSVPFGAFAQSATGDPCGMGLSMVAPKPRVCLNNGKSMVDQTKDLACTSLQATLSDPDLASVVGAVCMMSSVGGGGAASPGFGLSPSEEASIESIRARQFNQGQVFYRSEAAAATGPGRFVGTRRVATRRGADSSYHLSSWNPMEVIRTYRLKQDVTLPYGKVKNGTGYQAFIPRSYDPSDLLELVNEEPLK